MSFISSFNLFYTDTGAFLIRSGPPSFWCAATQRFCRLLYSSWIRRNRSTACWAHSAGGVRLCNPGRFASGPWPLPPCWRQHSLRGRWPYPSTIRRFSHDDLHRSPARFADPAASIRASFGLDESYSRYAAQTVSWRVIRPVMRRSSGNLSKRTSHARLGYFFLTHPTSGYRVLTAALGHGGRQKPNLGNYDKSAGRPPWAESRAFALWSQLKRSLLLEGWMAPALFRSGRLLQQWCGVDASHQSLWVAWRLWLCVTRIALIEMGVACLGTQQKSPDIASSSDILASAVVAVAASRRRGA